MNIIEWNLTLNGDDVLKNETNDDLRLGNNVASEYNHTYDCTLTLANWIIVLMIPYTELYFCPRDCVLD